jgi:hypothetical protein
MQLIVSSREEASLLHSNRVAISSYASVYLSGGLPMIQLVGWSEPDNEGNILTNV